MGAKSLGQTLIVLNLAKAGQIAPTQRYGGTGLRLVITRKLALRVAHTPTLLGGPSRGRISSPTEADQCAPVTGRGASLEGDHVCAAMERAVTQ